MKNIYIFALFLILCSYSFAQKESAIWQFGHGSGIDFRSGYPFTLSGGMTSSDNATSCISDSDGNLLFYTDGISIWNKNHEVMDNGMDLAGSYEATQSSVIVPAPGSSEIYFVFTVDPDPNGNGLAFSQIDMARKGGLGSVTSKNIKLADSVGGKICALPDEQGTGHWIIVYSYGHNKLLAFHKIKTDNTIDTTTISGPLSDEYSDVSYRDGYLKASATRNMVAVSFPGESSSIVEFHEFDRKSGKFKYWAYVYSSMLTVQGIEFSQNGDYLYSSFIGDGQARLWSWSTFDNVGILESTKELTISTNREFTGMQLAPDNNIYIACNNGDFLDAIYNADTQEAEYSQNAIDLVGTSSGNAPPQFASVGYIEAAYTDIALGSSTYSAKPGEYIEVPVTITQSKHLLSSGANGFGFTLTYNRSILTPNTDNIVSDTIRGMDRSTEFHFDFDSEDTLGTIASVRFYAALGSATYTDITVSDFYWEGGICRAQNIKSSGFILNGVCDGGGLRLIDPESQIALNRLIPNPVSNCSELEFSTVETGKTEVYLVNTLGQKSVSLYCGYPGRGRHSIPISTADIPEGIYFIVLKTPTVIRTLKMELVH